MQIKVTRESAAEYVLSYGSRASVATIPAPRKFYSRAEAERIARAEAEAYGTRAVYCDPHNGISHGL